MMATPDRGMKTVFLGVTESSGRYIVSNLMAIKRVAKKWVILKGWEGAMRSTPYIIVSATYVTPRGVYFKQGAIELPVTELLEGKSYTLKITINLSKTPNLPPVKPVQTGSWGTRCLKYRARRSSSSTELEHMHLYLSLIHI